MRSRPSLFLAGLFLTTLSVLALEILDTRFLSVLTWYHLSFFAVSMAMFGMSAGAVRVYLGGDRYRGDNARTALAQYGLAYAASVPLSHLVNLVIPLHQDPSLTSVVAMVVATLVLACPFYLAGVVVAIALTRIPGQTGVVYAVDLVGAALGALMIIPVLEWTNISSAVFVSGAFAFVGAACFAAFAGIRARPAAVWGALLLLLAVGNGMTIHGFRVNLAKNAPPSSKILYERWNSHSQVIAEKVIDRDRPWYWGVVDAPEHPVKSIGMYIDSGAGTWMTQWDGTPEQLEWVKYDVTSTAYHLRKGGDAAVIGVGGGRDVLTALWARSHTVTGIELNEVLLDLLRGPLRDFARIADRPGVKLVHDEARSYLTRDPQRYDVLQMSLIDTWAATGAGAFTLSENGLYTLEAWKVFLDALKPNGIFTVSRWFSPDKVSEASRLVALGTASLLRRGVAEPSQHVALLSAKSVATLLISAAPFTPEEVQLIRDTADRFKFNRILIPGEASSHTLLGRIVASRSLEALRETIADDRYDFSPPSDQRPYFFNILKPSGLLKGGLQRSEGVIASGNLLATGTLLLLGLISLALVVLLILLPLRRAGLPQIDASTFAHAGVYFGLIGAGFMMVQIPLMQRFSPYLGHPTHSLAVILFSMILFTGLGSWLSDRLPTGSSSRVLFGVPAVIAAILLIETLLLQTVIDATIRQDLLVRSLVVGSITASVALFMGFCFPIGLRLLTRISDGATPWMWGINGACGVLASVLAVITSMWGGIDLSLYLAAALYLSLLVPMGALWRRGNEIEGAVSQGMPEDRGARA